MMARFTRSDVSVIALIGERGREVKEFLDHDLGEEGLARSCVVAATSDIFSRRANPWVDPCRILHISIQEDGS